MNRKQKLQPESTSNSTHHLGSGLDLVNNTDYPFKTLELEYLFDGLMEECVKTCDPSWVLKE